MQIKVCLIFFLLRLLFLAGEYSTSFISGLNRFCRGGNEG